MTDQHTTLTVSVPPDGLYRYCFLGLDYKHDEDVPDRRSAWPVARGVPLPKGAVTDVQRISLRNESGEPVARQVRPLAHWDDNSVMFVHVAWQCDVAHDKPASFTLEVNSQTQPPLPPEPVKVVQGADVVEVDNGPFHAVIGRESDVPTLRLERYGKVVFEGALDLWTRSDTGKLHVGKLNGADSIRVVESGPMVGIVELRGRHSSDDGGVFLEYQLRLRFDAGRDELTFTHAFINLGDEADGVVVGEIGLRLPPIIPAGPYSHAVCQTTSGFNSFSRLVEFPENVDITIGATLPRIKDLASLREDTSEYPPYLMTNRDVVDQWFSVRTADWAAATFFLEGKENWPKRLKVTDGVLEYHLWPSDANLHKLRQGMARTHHVRLAFFEPDAKPIEFHRYCQQCAEPPNVVVPFEWYQKCEVWGMQYVMPWLPKQYRRLEGVLLSTIERSWTTGMLGYGDDPDSGYDYTNVGMADETVWINNEHDYTSQAVIQTWRSGRPGAWKCARLAAEHQIDVDFVRKSADRWKEGGIPAHSHFHTTAAVYPSHTWTEGLLQYYLTSGDDRALEVAKSLGRNLCQYVEERMEALETESRMMGWALIALVAVIEVVHDERCLQAAHKIRDDIQEVVDRKGSYDRGGMNYGTGIVLTGLANLHRVTADQSALKLMLSILDWHMEHGRNEIDIAWNKRELMPYGLNLTLPAYAYAWHATSDRKYLEEGLAFFHFTGPPGPTPNIRSIGKQYRTYMPFLKVAHDAGELADMEKRIQWSG